MRLVISEKTSMARSIAAVIGANQKQKGYLEGNDYFVSWCVGHLVELAPPSAYDERYAKWRKEDLPIVPASWQYIITEATKPQFNILRSLMNDKRVDGIICATDAGREGELIFRLVYEQCGCHKPVQRLWISSMEEAAIAAGFRDLKPASAYDDLYHAALCRSQADWLVGINATRLFSTMYGKTLNIGRVMTPTLAMIVERESQIAAFRSMPFYTVQLDCDLFVASSERLENRAEAERIAALCNGKEARISKLEHKQIQDKPPKLYDLTALQRDANRLLGFTAQQTLDYAQALYERQLATYPRTDSRFLTSHMEGSIQTLANATIKTLPFACPAPVCCHSAQVIDDGKVSDHHAIIPTMSVTKSIMDSLPGGERSLLTLLMTRLICAVGEPCQVKETSVTVECEGMSFSAKGKQVLNPGWRAIERAYLNTLKDHPTEDAPVQELPPLNDQMSFLPVGASIKEGKTTPPKSYTEATLLSAMETAGARDMPDDAERKGLGTPATRAGVIEKLVKVGLMERKRNKKGCVLLPTPKGVSLITVVPEEIHSPLLTAEWEQQLKRIEQGEHSPEAFMDSITDMVQGLVSNAQCVKDSSILFKDDRRSIGTCPGCGAPVVENSKGFVCANHACRFALWKENRFFTSKRKALTPSIAAALLKEGRVFVKGLYSEKTDKTYDATIVLDDTGGEYVNFKLEFAARNGGTA